MARVDLSGNGAPLSLIRLRAGPPGLFLRGTLPPSCAVLPRRRPLRPPRTPRGTAPPLRNPGTRSWKPWEGTEIFEEQRRTTEAQGEEEDLCRSRAAGLPETPSQEQHQEG